MVTIAQVFFAPENKLIRDNSMATFAVLNQASRCVHIRREVVNKIASVYERTTIKETIKGRQ